MLLQPFGHIEQLTTINSISTGGGNFTWSDMFNLTFISSRTNRHLVPIDHLTTAGKRSGHAAISD